MDDEAIRRLVRSQPVPDKLIRKLREVQHVDAWDVDRVIHHQQADIPLTRHEVDMLRAFGDGGLRRDEVAAVLGCSVESVKTTLKTVKAKLRAKTTAQAVARAIRQDLI